MTLEDYCPQCGCFNTTTNPCKYCGFPGCNKCVKACELGHVEEQGTNWVIQDKEVK